MTGVHQTTPVGTPVTAEGTSTTATVTVGSVGADDLLVSNLYSGWNGAIPGASETEQWEQIHSAVVTGAGNTQLGSAGGVMSNTQTLAGFSDDWILGAVAFKPAAAGAAAGPLIGPNILNKALVGGGLAH